MENQKENKTATNQLKNRYAGMTADQVLAQALSGKAAEINREKEAKIVPIPAATPPVQEEVTYTPDEAMSDITASLEKIRAANEAAATVKDLAPMPIQNLAKKDTSNLLKVTELFTMPERLTDTFVINGHKVEIQLNPSYDTLVQAVGLATNLVIDSGDNYIFSPNQKIIGALVFLRTVTNINLEFLALTEIRVSQLIETYDILMPLIKHIESLDNVDFVYRYNWYNEQLTTSISAATQYQNSAKGIVDALAEHNIKNQTSMIDQLAEADSTKLSTMIDFMAAQEKK